MQFRTQVLPAPLGPMIASISLSRTSMLMSTSAFTPPKDRERWSILILTLFDVVTSFNQAAVSPFSRRLRYFISVRQSPSLQASPFLFFWRFAFPVAACFRLPVHLQAPSA